MDVVIRNGRLALAALALIVTACTSQPSSPRVTPPQPEPIAIRRELPRSAEPAPMAIPAPVDLAMDIPNHPTVRNALVLLTTRLRPGVQDSMLRSAQYKPMIDAILDEYGLPRALAYLPVVESAYAPTLTSRAGARGIWQFMKATARDYGLRVDEWIDERADPERSTRAAAAYLRDLHRQFRDWPLVLAAYNAGASRVRRAMSATGSSTYWDLVEATALPSETRGYVPSFYAAIIIASDPYAYGFRLGEPAQDDVRRVEIDGPLSLRQIAEAAGIPESTLIALNPAYYRCIVPPGRSTLRVPAAAAEMVLARTPLLKNEDATFAELTEPQIVQQQYEVKKGDTMYSIARRYALTVDELRDLNGLPPEHVIHPGDKLVVSASRAVTTGGM